MAQLHYIQGPPEPLLSLLNGSREYASDFQKGARDLDALLSFASIGADIDAGAVGRRELRVSHTRDHVPPIWLD